MIELTQFILISGFAVFAVATVATIWTGYILFERLWRDQHLDTPLEDEVAEAVTPVVDLSPR